MASPPPIAQKSARWARLEKLPAWTRSVQGVVCSKIRHPRLDLVGHGFSHASLMLFSCERSSAKISAADLHGSTRINLRQRKAASVLSEIDVTGPASSESTTLRGRAARKTASTSTKPVILPRGKYPFPSRTRKSSPAGPIVLHAKVCGRVGRRRHKQRPFAYRERPLPFCRQNQPRICTDQRG